MRKLFLIGIIVSVLFAKPIDLECKLKKLQHENDDTHLTYLLNCTVDSEKKEADCAQIQLENKKEVRFKGNMIIFGYYTMASERSYERSIENQDLPFAIQNHVYINRENLRITDEVSTVSMNGDKIIYHSLGECSIKKYKNKI